MHNNMLKKSLYYLINVINQQQLPHRTMSNLSTYLKYTEYGEPVKVVKKYTETLGDPKDDEVLVQLLASPINPADINTIQGKYPEKPQLPAVPGNECVAKVIVCGSSANELKCGDHVISKSSQIGTWRTMGVFKENQLMKIPNELNLIDAATLMVNPPTAYRMLKDYVTLSEGDTVIQNGANSAVGQLTFQLCRIWGLNCIGIVRNRPDLPKLIAYLKDLGASEILTEEQLRTTDLFKRKVYAKPKLALNCVGGKNATEIVRHLQDKGCMVTYGGMSREPVIAPTAALIFKDITFNGFWMTRWTKENFSHPKRTEMFNELIGYMGEGKIKTIAHKLIPFDKYETALGESLNATGFSGEKLIFDFQSNSSSKL